MDNIGKVYRAQGRYAEALEAYEQAMAVFEALRSMAGSEAGRAGFIAQYANLYDRAVELYHQPGPGRRSLLHQRARPQPRLPRLAGHRLRRARGQRSRRAAGGASRKPTPPARLRRTPWPRPAASTPPDPALVADLEAQLAAAEQEHQAALDAITARGGQLAALAPGRSGVLDLAAVQALLDDQTTLVSYWVLGDGGSLAFVVTGDSFTTVALPAATPANLDRALTDLRQWSNLENPQPKPLRDLHAWLVAPLTAHLQTPQVVIVPHQALHYVPFAALSDGQSYFGQQHLLSVLPSASALPFIQQNAAKAAGAVGTQALVFGNPTTGDPSLPSLAHAASEAQAVAALLGTTAVTDAAASETRLRKEAAGSKVIHLAAHGGYNVANPLYSAIYLAPGGAGAAGRWPAGGARDLRSEPAGQPTGRPQRLPDQRRQAVGRG